MRLSPKVRIKRTNPLLESKSLSKTTAPKVLPVEYRAIRYTIRVRIERFARTWPRKCSRVSKRRKPTARRRALGPSEPPAYGATLRGGVVVAGYLVKRKTP